MRKKRKIRKLNRKDKQRLVVILNRVTSFFNDLFSPDYNNDYSSDDYAHKP